MQTRLNESSSSITDLLCFSHLRWDWVFQRPQHLFTRAARTHRVFFIEEPVFGSDVPHMEEREQLERVVVVRPSFPDAYRGSDTTALMRELLDGWLASRGVDPWVIWYYTPMALPFSRHLDAPVTVYDCMDELSTFSNAPESLPLLERQLMQLCDVVFTGGHSLYEAKAKLHPNVHEMPSSVDAEHFVRARYASANHPDYRHIPHPRIGYCGVIDERMDLELVEGIARARPDWHQVFIGPVTKIDPAALPQGPNVHYLGARPYEELPALLGACDVGMLPFALNAATRYISPTKTPEYLAAGLPVVSTPICDVVWSWGRSGLVRIAGTIEGFVEATSAAILEPRELRWPRVDRTLAALSWDATWQRMEELLIGAAARAA